MNPTGLLKAFEQFYPFLVAGSLATTRMFALMSIMPMFTRLGISGLLQTVVALVFALPVLPLIVDVVAAEPFTLGRYMVLIAKEAVIGLALGVVLGVPFWAAEAAGDVVDLQRGSSFAGLLDPSSASETSVTGTLFAVAMVAMFYANGGLGVVLRTVYESYGIWPVSSTAPVFSADTGRIVLSLLDDVMSMGLMLAVPIVLALLLSDVCLALVARAAPHLHVFDLSLSVKSMVFCLVLVIYSAFLLNYMEADLRWLLSAKDKLEALHGR
jgi:type III secretion protein T